MPKLSGLEVIEWLHKGGSPFRRDSPDHFTQGHFSGRFVLAIQVAASGKTIVRPGVMERVPDHLRNRPNHFESSILPEALTTREVEALRKGW